MVVRLHIANFLKSETISMAILQTYDLTVDHARSWCDLAELDYYGTEATKHGRSYSQSYGTVEQHGLRVFCELHVTVCSYT